MGSVRNCKELGKNAKNIIKKLLANQTLLKLLYYTDKDPLSHEDLSPEQVQKEIYQNLIRIVPRVGDYKTAQSMVVMRITDGYVNNENGEIKDINLVFEVFVPLTEWIIKDTNLRPFAILGEIQKSLKGEKVDGFGTIQGGDFALNFLTDELSDYIQTYSIQIYD